MLQIDAIWVTQLVPTGSYHRDAKGCCRPDNQRIKRPVLIALGVWPETDRAEVLACRLADKEDEAAWLAFLSELEALGIRGENGLELVIHDGGSGLCAALHTVYFGAAEQRCLFHKLRNLYQTLRMEDEPLSSKRRRRRKTLFRDFYHIWQAKRLPTLLQRYLQVVRRYRTTQPEAIRCLRTDFRTTIAIPTGHSNTCAPPVVSNASIAASGAGLVPPPPIILMPRSRLCSPMKSTPSTQPTLTYEFQPIKIHYRNFGRHWRDRQRQPAP